MAAINDDPRRQVVPLWRSFDLTNSRGELASVGQAEERYTDESVADLVADWREFGTVSVAADLVSVAFGIGRFGPAVEAARQILADSAAPPTAVSVARHYLAGGGVPAVEPPTASPDVEKPVQSLSDQLRTEIAVARRQLAEYPFNPILWSNVARLYTSLGVREKAERAIRIAVSMAPHNRYVLRAASRYYLHNRELDRAFRLLSDSPLVRTDPWILSAEIATAASINRASRNIKLARRIIEAERFSPFHLSELGSALGTLESVAGNIKAGRRLIQFSLMQPADNAVAQAAWLSRNVSDTLTGQISSTTSAEANAWFAFQAANWRGALLQSGKWLVDQPYSSRPARLGAHIASILLDDYEQGRRLAEYGLMSNPDDFGLRNLVAFSLAKKGDPVGAEQAYSLIDPRRLTVQQRVVWQATRGLIAFRAGRHDEGRRLYTEAISLAKQLQDAHEPLARLYLAMEELRVRSPDAERVRQAALAGAKSLTAPVFQVVVEKVRAIPVIA